MFDTGVVCRRLESPDDPLFWPALEFYVESFPREEREQLSRVARVASGDTGLCEGERRRIRCAVAELGGALAGFRYHVYDADAGLAFFVYLAVEPALRRLGIGRRLIDFGRAECIRDAELLNSRLEAIVFECERPELARSALEREVREARITYFLNRGARLVSKDYHQPSLGPDRLSVPLYLMAYPVSAECDWADVAVRFHRIILGYPADSPEERAALSGMA